MDWNALAGTYDAQLWLERQPLKVALELARPRAEDSFLDLATGTGAVLEQLATRVPRPLKATGVDSSSAMLARVKPLPSPWRLVLADVGSLPFEAGSFDVAVAAYFLHVLDAQARHPALREIHRVLRPGGALVTVTPTLPLASDHPLHRRVARYLETRSGRRRGLLPLDPRPMLAASGFEVEEVRRVWLGYPSLSVRVRRL